MERVKGIGPSQPAWKAGALPLSYTRKYKIMVEESGFEPLKAKLTDLQSVPFGQLGYPSKGLSVFRFRPADEIYNTMVIL